MVEIDEKYEALFLGAEKLWPQIWKWTQREANRETPFEDVLYAVELFVKRGGHENPWAYFERVIKARKNKKEIVEREEEWNRKKIK